MSAAWVTSNLLAVTARRALASPQPRTVIAKYAFSTNSNSYVSHLQELFDQMDRNETTLGVDASFLKDDKMLPCGLPESSLRFTTTHYGRLLQAPFVHQNEHTVVMTARLGNSLSETEQLILKEIVGERFDTEKKTLRLTSRQFGSRIENKRHLVSMLNRIVTSCKNLAKQAEEEERMQA